MHRISYVKRGSAGQGTGVLYDELISQVRPFLIEEGIILTTEKVGESKSRQTAKGGYIFECDYKVSYINIDDPKDRIENIVEAHAMDAGDKATGKAITYATKISLLKVLSLETGLNDESREEIREKLNTIDQDQFNKLAEFCLTTTENGQLAWTAIGQKLSAAYKIQTLEQLPKSKFNDALTKCQRAAVKNENN